VQSLKERNYERCKEWICKLEGAFYLTGVSEDSIKQLGLQADLLALQADLLGLSAVLLAVQADLLALQADLLGLYAALLTLQVDLLLQSKQRFV